MRQNLPRAIGTLGLVFVLFFSTSGGPYTTETLIYSVGPGLGLLILALVPLVWSVPEALIVGELASMLPEEGGYYRWVDRAFGRSMDQRPRLSERHSRFNYRRLLHRAGLSCLVSRECAAHHSHSMATVRVGTRSR